MLGQSLPCESSVKFTKVFPLVTNCFRKQILEVNWSEKKYGNSDFMKPSYRWGWQAQRGGQLSTVPQPRSGKSERSSQMSINWWVHSTQCKVKTASWRSMLQGESSWAEHWNLFSPLDFHQWDDSWMGVGFPKVFGVCHPEGQGIMKSVPKKRNPQFFCGWNNGV